VAAPVAIQSIPSAPQDNAPVQQIAPIMGHHHYVTIQLKLSTYEKYIQILQFTGYKQPTTSIGFHISSSSYQWQPCPTIQF
jgi:hypothetical protein